jgi:hypothetical protein
MDNHPAHDKREVDELEKCEYGVVNITDMKLTRSVLWKLDTRLVRALC